jgi:peptidoglycan hydrolase CwlO-like protein
MKTGKIETLTLALGGLVLVAAAIMTFGFGNNPKAGMWTNIMLSLGFLVYILYNMGSTINASKKIGDLELRVQSLEADVNQLEQQKVALQTSLNQSQTDLREAGQHIENLKAVIEEKEKLIAALEEQAASETSKEGDI